jgi:predicted helicase
VPLPTPALELRALTKRYDDGVLALIRDGRLIARDTADGLRAAYDADWLADVYVKAMAGVDVRSPT